MEKSDIEFSDGLKQFYQQTRISWDKDSIIQDDPK